MPPLSFPYSQVTEPFILLPMLYQTQVTSTISTYPIIYNNIWYQNTSSTYIPTMSNETLNRWWINNIIMNNIANVQLESSLPRFRPHRVEPQPRMRLPETDEADERAKTLLFSQLTEEQRKSFVENGWFLVLSKRSGRQYRVNVSHLVANVTRLDDGARLCAHCDPSLPRSDHLLAQKLMLEYDEEAFLRVANRH
jgi:hypothetical protein